MKLYTQQKDSSTTSTIKIRLIYVLTQQTTPLQYHYITFLLTEVLKEFLFIDMSSQQSSDHFEYQQAAQILHTEHT
jgi:hypothetical protein